jgi:hypothetical protein
MACTQDHKTVFSSQISARHADKTIRILAGQKPVSTQTGKLRPDPTLKNSLANQQKFEAQYHKVLSTCGAKDFVAPFRP